MIIDWERLSADLKIDKHVYLRILAAAVSQTKTDLSAISAALNQNDREAVQMISHRWKGDYASLRLEEISGMARDLNEAVKAGQPVSALQRLLDGFQKAFEELKKTMDAK